MSYKKRKEASSEEVLFRSKKGFGVLEYVYNGKSYRFYETRSTKAPKNLQSLFFLERANEPVQKEKKEEKVAEFKIPEKPEGDKE